LRVDMGGAIMGDQVIEEEERECRGWLLTWSARRPRPLCVYSTTSMRETTP